MDCAHCGSKMKNRVGLVTRSKIVGVLDISGVEYDYCENCDDSLLSPKALGAVQAHVQKKEREAIDKLPIGEFVSSKEAADILDISKQALSKHKRIQRGFVYFSTIGQSKLYHKPSLMAFMASGDGRVSLNLDEHKQASNAIFIKHHRQADNAIFVALDHQTTMITITGDAVSGSVLGVGTVVGLDSQLPESGFLTHHEHGEDDVERETDFFRLGPGRMQVSG